MELREFVELVMHELEGFALVDGVVHFSVRVYGGKDDNGNKYAELLTHSAEHNIIQTLAFNRTVNFSGAYYENENRRNS